MAPRRAPALWLCGAVLAAALSAAAESTGPLVLEDAWVRALPPTQRVTAAYLRVTNPGATPVRITGAEAAGAGRAALHDSVETDAGMARMQPVPSLPLGPGASVTLAPRGLHIMLMDLERMPQPGASLRLCLLTSDGGRSCTDARVRRGAGQAH